MVIHDFYCDNDKCAAEFKNQLSTCLGAQCPECRKGRLNYLWVSALKRDANVHPSERAVIYYSKKEGKFQYPGRNNRPMPKRLQSRGYERVEFNSAHDLARHERKNNVASHVLNYDRNGHSYDGSDS